MERFNFKKKYGQNFLIDKNIINKIIKMADIMPNSLIVEIGCGSGNLTKDLCKNASYVIGYEIDRALEEVLKENLKDFNNYTIIIDDFLNRNIMNDIKNLDYQNIYFISNLPYYITTPIIEKIISSNINFEKIVVMVQKEVGERFCSKVGCKDYSSITVFLNYYFNIKKYFDVSREVFIPKPNVDSMVIGLESKKNKIPLLNETVFFELVKDSFKYKRKTLRNNLRENYDLQKIEKVLVKSGLDLSVRAEKIKLEIFCDIANNLSNI